MPPPELETITLIGSHEFIVDVGMMLMYSATLDVELKPLVRSLRNLYSSGEELVYKVRGRGAIWPTPTLRMG